jgi:hypothetical protein
LRWLRWLFRVGGDAGSNPARRGRLAQLDRATPPSTDLFPHRWPNVNPYNPYIDGIKFIQFDMKKRKPCFADNEV